MSPQLEALPSHSESEGDVADFEGRTQARALPAERGRPSLRELVVLGGLFIAYVGALTAIGISRFARWPFRRRQNQ